MRKKLSLLMVALIALAAFAAQAFRAAEKTVVSWKVDAAPAVGTAFQVQNGTEDVLQVAFGAMDPSKDDKDATTYITGDANVSITYGEQTFSFDKYASTSKTNGNNSASLAADGSSIGNYMAFTPKYDGKLIIVVQNQGGKTTCLYEDGVQKGGTLIGSGDANVDFNGAEDLKPLNNATNYSGGILVEVKAGSLYTISVAGSKGRWMGVIYEYEATPHEHNYVPDYNQYVEPTCTVDGKIVFVCECGASYEDIIPALGHDFDENGKCSRCGYTQGSGESQGDQWVKTTSIAVDDVILLTSEGSTSSTTWCKELSEFSGNVGKAVDFTETPAGLQPLTVEAGSAEGTFAFKNAEGKYLAANSSNQLPIVDALGDNSSWTVTWESDVPTIANVGTPARKLQYNSGSPRFACYTTTQKPVTIWKKVAGPTPKPVLPGEVVWSSETPQIINWSEEDQRIIIAPERFANAKVGDIVHVSVENPIINEENEWAGQVSLMSGNWKELEKTKPIASGTVTDAAYTLTGDMVKALKATGMIVFGAGYSTSLVTLESCGDDPLASDESVWFGDATLTWTQVQVYYSHFVNIDVKAGDIIKLTYEATGSPNIQLVYGWSEGQNYGAVTYGDGFATLEVTADKVETLKSKGLTVNADGIRLTLIEVLEPIVPVAVLWSSEDPVAPTWGAADILVKVDQSEVLANAKVGDIIHVAAEVANPDPANAWGVQVAIKDGAFADLEASKPIGDQAFTDAQFVITGDILKYIKLNGLMVSGTGYTTKLVTLETTELTGSDESVWVGNSTSTVTVNVNHFKNANDKAGIKAGDIIRVTATLDEGATDPWLNAQYSGNDTGWAWVAYENMDPQPTGTGFDFVVPEGNVAQLLTDGIIIAQVGYTVTQVEVVAPSGPEVIDLTLVLTDQPYDIGATVAAAKEEVLATGNLVGNITVKLSSEFAYTTTASIEAPGSVSIFGDGATIDASALTGPFIQMSTTPVVAPVLAEDGVTVKCYPIDGIELQDLTITGLPYQLLYANETRYLMDHVAVGNCVIGINGKAKKTIFDFNRGGNVAELIVDHSTLWANPSNALNGGFFSSQAGQGAIQDLGSDRQITAIQSSTIYNIAYGRTFSSKRRNSTNGMEYKVKNSLIVNSGKKGEFVVGLNGGAYKNNLTWNIEDNAFNFDNGDTSELEIAKVGNDEGGNPIVKDCVAGVADFTNADGGDFNGTFILPAGGTAPETMPGDPRWTLTAVASYTITIADDMVNGTVTSDRAYASEGATVTLTAIPDAGFMLDAYSVTCNTSNEAVVVTDINTFVMPADDVTVSATFVKAPIAIVVNAEDITDGDITAAVNAKKTAVTDAGDAVGDITINLDGNSSYTVSGSIEAPASLTFKGNGATIDASGLESPLITTPEGNLEKWMVGNMYITHITVKGLKKSIYASRGKNYLYKNFYFNHCFIEMAATDGFEFDFRKGGVAEQFTLYNSTIYAPTATKNSLYTSQNGQRATEAPGVTTQKFSIRQCTMYNLAKGKNFFTHRQSGQTWLDYTLKSSIFVNCGKKGQVVKGMNQGQASPNPSWHVSGNVFNFDGADTSAEESTGDDAEPVENNIAGFIEFADAENGDFNGIFALAPAAEEPQAAPRRADSETVPMLNCGDTRWKVVAGESYDIDVQENIENGTVTADKTYAANGMTVTLTVTPAEGYELDVLVVQAFIGTDIIDIPVNEDNTFTMPAGDVFIAASFKLATGIANVAGDKYADGEWYTVGGVRIDKPTKKGLYIHNGKKVVVK